MSLGEGLKGNLQTMVFMKKIARLRSRDPLPRKLALEILAKARVPSNHFRSECTAIGNWVLKNIRYVKDPDEVEYLQDPVDLIKQFYAGKTVQGDCDDMALLTATLLLCVGHQPYFRAIRYDDSQGDNYNHIYVVVYEANPHENRRRIVLDCITKDKPIGYEIPHESGDEYEV